MIITGILLLLGYACMSVYDCMQAEKKGNRMLKPFLMPALALSYVVLCSARNKEILWLLFLALIFGCLGDTFLLRQSDKWTLAGLCSFLAGHILYLILFLQQTDFTHADAVITALLIMGYLAYGMIVMKRLKPHLPKEFLLPATAYAFVIIVMSALAGMHFLTSFSAGSFLSWLGTVLFFVSDTILAFSMFASGKGRGVMETYVLAQFFIMLGFIL